MAWSIGAVIVVNAPGICNTPEEDVNSTVDALLEVGDDENASTTLNIRQRASQHDGPILLTVFSSRPADEESFKKCYELR